MANSIFKQIMGWFGRSETTQLGYTQPTPDGDERGVASKVKRRYEFRSDLSMKTWEAAVREAENAIRPRRLSIYKVYHRAMEDEHLLAQVRTARFTVQMSPFEVRKGKAKDETLTEMLETNWFNKYLSFALDSELYGHSLVEFIRKQVDGEFTDVALIPREHVRPEYETFVVDVYEEEGIPYNARPWRDYLISIGDRYDLGLLKVASKAVIRKDYAIVDWSRRNEKYGMPFLVLKTTSRKESELQAKADMAANFGSNSWAIFDDQDTATLLESSQAFTFQSFDKFADRMDGYVSILINGQTGTTEEKAYVGSAEVHERILNTYTMARLARIEAHINDELIPFLIGHGYPLEGTTFVFTELLKKPKRETTEEKASEDATAEAASTATEEESEALKLSLDSKKKSCCPGHDEPLKLNFDLGALAEKVMRQVWERKLAAGEVDPESWAEYERVLTEAMEEGTGSSFGTSYSNGTSWEMRAQLRRNIQAFAAFKNHAAVADLAAMLNDPLTGDLRSWEQFRTAAQPVVGNYYENWLQAEYNAAVSSSQMAVKWIDIQANKDVMPFLEYVTQNDARVRSTHRALHGVTLPVDNPFWDEFYPPNGWNCRCTVIQTAGPERQPDAVLSEEQQPAVFKHNVGKSEELFSQQHEYFQKGMTEAQRERLIKATRNLVYENYDDAEWKRLGISPDGGYVVESATAGTARRSDNLTAAEKLMTREDAVEILNNDLPLPDLSINGRLWAVASSAEGLQEAMTRAGAKKRILVIDDGTKELADAVKAARAEGFTIEILQ